MKYNDIKFSKGDKLFTHSHKSDLSLFVLWKDAYPYIDRIEELLSTKFEILLKTEIIWTKRNFRSNILRLYEHSIYENQTTTQSILNLEEKVGDNKFILFVIKDENPKYSYAQSVSKKIELSNLNIISVKREVRKLIQKNTNNQYAVHSTNNIKEFFVQCPLLLGVNMFKSIVNGEKIEAPVIEKDLEGAEGWESLTDLFEIWNTSSNYLILRGFEEIFEKKEQIDELDMLVEDYQSIASIAGAIQIKDIPYKGTIQVGGNTIHLDLRYVGDKYYPPIWAKEMLDTKTFQKNIYIPREDHYFFSLLYHAKVQKPSVKEVYKPILERIANNLAFDWYSTDILDDDKLIGDILNGYYRNYGYYFEDPVDKKVYKNDLVINHIRRYEKDKKIKKDFTTRKNEIKHKIKMALPESIVSIIQKITK